MNADVIKIRDSKLFKSLPDRAFDRMLNHLKIRAFGRGESVLDYQTDRKFEKYFGYVVTGRVVFLADGGKPLGMVLSDEFFVGRAFSIDEKPVSTVVSAADNTMIVYIPKSIVEILSEHSESFSERIEEIYDSIYERSEMISADPQGKENFEAWLKNADRTDKTLSSWLVNLEKKRIDALKRRQKLSKEKSILVWYWIGAIVLSAVVIAECTGRIYQGTWAPSYQWTGEFGEYSKKSNFNIWLGIFGFALVFLTNLHTVNRVLIRKYKFKINYKRSSHGHILLGLVGTLLIYYHTAGHLQGGNIAHFAINALFIGLISGIIGQLISSRIPKTIGGEKMKLKSIKKDQEKLRKKAELLMDDNQFKTSIALLNRPLPKSFWLNLLSAPFLIFRSQRIRRSLEGLGLGKEGSKLAASYLRKEFEIQQKIRSLEIANVFFKRWMWIHKPIGYSIYLMGFAHIALVYLQGLLKDFLNSPF